MIPRTIHFISLFGPSGDFGGHPFSMYHYLAALSAKVINKDCEVVLHYYQEPSGNQWWERCKHIAKMDRLTEIPTVVHGKEVKLYAHKADWLRLEILAVEGGIYLDMDTICIRPFESLLGVEEGIVMGLEVFGGRVNGLCNAVIMAEKEHRLIKLWQSEFVSSFDANVYNKFGVQTPWKIALKTPRWIHIEPPESFFRLNWNTEDLKVMYEQTITFDRSYLAHLLHGSSYSYLSKLTLEEIETTDTSYNLLARKVINEARSQSIL